MPNASVSRRPTSGFVTLLAAAWLACGPAAGANQPKLSNEQLAKLVHRDESVRTISG